MPAPENPFDLVRNAPGAGDFRNAFGRGSWWPQLKQCRAFYIGGFSDAADAPPIVDEKSLYSCRAQARRTLGSWRDHIGSEWATPSPDQSRYALHSHPMTFDNACLQIRALELCKARRNGRTDIYESIWIEPCIWSLVNVGGNTLEHIPRTVRDRFWHEAHRLIHAPDPQGRRKIEKQIAEGYGLPYQLAKLAESMFAEAARGIEVVVERRGLGNRKGACTTLSFQVFGPADDKMETRAAVNDPETAQAQR